MALVSRGLFLRSWTRRDSAIAAIVANTSYGIVDDRGVVSVVDNVDVHVVDFAVVVEAPVVPTSAFIAVAEVAVAVIDPTIEADDRSPIAWGKEEPVATPSPVAGSPVVAGFGREHPCAGNPVVSNIVAPSPVARCPDVIGAGAFGLVVDGKIRRSEVDEDSDSDLRERLRAEN